MCFTFTVYLLELAKKKKYVGLTPTWRLKQREAEHYEGVGAKWTKRFPPKKLVQTWVFPTKKEASAFEILKTEELLHLHGIDSTRGGVCNYGQEGGYAFWVRPPLAHLIPT